MPRKPEKKTKKTADATKKKTKKSNKKDDSGSEKSKDVEATSKTTETSETRTSSSGSTREVPSSFFDGLLRSITAMNDSITKLNESRKEDAERMEKLEQRLMGIVSAEHDKKRKRDEVSSQEDKSVTSSVKQPSKKKQKKEENDKEVIPNNNNVTNVISLPPPVTAPPPPLPQPPPSPQKTIIQDVVTKSDDSTTRKNKKRKAPITSPNDGTLTSLDFSHVLSGPILSIRDLASKFPTKKVVADAVYTIRQYYFMYQTMLAQCLKDGTKLTDFPEFKVEAEKRLKSGSIHSFLNNPFCVSLILEMLLIDNIDFSTFSTCDLPIELCDFRASRSKLAQMINSEGSFALQLQFKQETMHVAPTFIRSPFITPVCPTNHFFTNLLTAIKKDFSFEKKKDSADPEYEKMMFPFAFNFVLNFIVQIVQVPELYNPSEQLLRPTSLTTTMDATYGRSGGDFPVYSGSQRETLYPVSKEVRKRNNSGASSKNYVSLYLNKKQRFAGESDTEKSGNDNPESIPDKKKAKNKKDVISQFTAKEADQIADCLYFGNVPTSSSEFDKSSGIDISPQKILNDRLENIKKIKQKLFLENSSSNVDNVIKNSTTKSEGSNKNSTSKSRTDNVFSDVDKTLFPWCSDENPDKYLLQNQKSELMCLLRKYLKLLLVDFENQNSLSSYLTDEAVLDCYWSVRQINRLREETRKCRLPLYSVSNWAFLYYEGQEAAKDSNKNPTDSISSQLPKTRILYDCSHTGIGINKGGVDKIGAHSKTMRNNLHVKAQLIPQNYIKIIMKMYYVECQFMSVCYQSLSTLFNQHQDSRLQKIKELMHLPLYDDRFEEKRCLAMTEEIFFNTPSALNIYYAKRKSSMTTDFSFHEEVSTVFPVEGSTHSSISDQEQETFIKDFVKTHSNSLGPENVNLLTKKRSANEYDNPFIRKFCKAFPHMFLYIVRYNGIDGTDKEARVASCSITTRDLSTLLVMLVHIHKQSQGIARVRSMLQFPELFSFDSEEKGKEEKEELNYNQEFLKVWIPYATDTINEKNGYLSVTQPFVDDCIVKGISDDPVIDPLFKKDGRKTILRLPLEKEDPVHSITKDEMADESAAVLKKTHSKRGAYVMPSYHDDAFLNLMKNGEENQAEYYEYLCSNSEYEICSSMSFFNKTMAFLKNKKPNVKTYDFEKSKIDRLRFAMFRPLRPKDSYPMVPFSAHLFHKKFPPNTRDPLDLDYVDNLERMATDLGTGTPDSSVYQNEIGYYGLAPSLNMIGHSIITHFFKQSGEKGETASRFIPQMMKNTKQQAENDERKTTHNEEEQPRKKMKVEKQPNQIKSNDVEFNEAIEEDVVTQHQPELMEDHKEDADDSELKRSPSSLKTTETPKSLFSIEYNSNGEKDSAKLRITDVILNLLTPEKIKAIQVLKNRMIWGGPVARYNSSLENPNKSNIFAKVIRNIALIRLIKNDPVSFFRERSRSFSNTINISKNHEINSNNGVVSKGGNTPRKNTTEQQRYNSSDKMIKFTISGNLEEENVDERKKACLIKHGITDLKKMQQINKILNGNGERELIDSVTKFSINFEVDCSTIENNFKQMGLFTSTGFGRQKSQNENGVIVVSTTTSSTEDILFKNILETNPNIARLKCLQCDYILPYIRFCISTDNLRCQISHDPSQKYHHHNKKTTKVGSVNSSEDRNLMRLVENKNDRTIMATKISMESWNKLPPGQKELFSYPDLLQKHMARSKIIKWLSSKKNTKNSSVKTSTKQSRPLLLSFIRTFSSSSTNLFLVPYEITNFLTILRTFLLERVSINSTGRNVSRDSLVIGEKDVTAYTKQSLNTLTEEAIKGGTKLSTQEIQKAVSMNVLAMKDIPQQKGIMEKFYRKHILTFFERISHNNLIIQKNPTFVSYGWIQLYKLYGQDNTTKSELRNEKNLRGYDRIPSPVKDVWNNTVKFIEKIIHNLHRSLAEYTDGGMIVSPEERDVSRKRDVSQLTLPKLTGLSYLRGFSLETSEKLKSTDARSKKFELFAVSDSQFMDIITTTQEDLRANLQKYTETPNSFSAKKESLEREKLKELRNYDQTKIINRYISPLDRILWMPSILPSNYMLQNLDVLALAFASSTLQDLFFQELPERLKFDDKFLGFVSEINTATYATYSLSTDNATGLVRYRPHLMKDKISRLKVFKDRDAIEDDDDKEDETLEAEESVGESKRNKKEKRPYSIDIKDIRDNNNNTESLEENSTTKTKKNPHATLWKIFKRNEAIFNPQIRDLVHTFAIIGRNYALHFEERCKIGENVKSSPEVDEILKEIYVPEREENGINKCGYLLDDKVNLAKLPFDDFTTTLIFSQMFEVIKNTIYKIGTYNQTTFAKLIDNNYEELVSELTSMLGGIKVNYVLISMVHINKILEALLHLGDLLTETVKEKDKEDKSVKSKTTSKKKSTEVITEDEKQRDKLKSVVKKSLVELDLTKEDDDDFETTPFSTSTKGPSKGNDSKAVDELNKLIKEKLPKSTSSKEEEKKEDTTKKKGKKETKKKKETKQPKKDDGNSDTKSTKTKKNKKEKKKEKKSDKKPKTTKTSKKNS